MPAPKTPSMHLALLRSINVGGKNSLPMKDLAALFTDAGCGDVKTYIQSGNVIFRATPSTIKRIQTSIPAVIAERHGFKTSIVLRTADQLAEVIRNNPFLAAGAAEKELHVLFLSDRPSEQAVHALHPIPASPDQFIVRGQEVYLRLPNGMGRTKLPNFDAKLGVTVTARNWRTVLTLSALMTD